MARTQGYGSDGGRIVRNRPDRLAWSIGTRLDDAIDLCVAIQSRPSQMVSRPDQEWSRVHADEWARLEQAIRVALQVTREIRAHAAADGHAEPAEGMAVGF